MYILKTYIYICIEKNNYIYIYYIQRERVPPQKNGGLNPPLCPWFHFPLLKKPTVFTQLPPTVPAPSAACGPKRWNLATQTHTNGFDRAPGIFFFDGGFNGGTVRFFPVRFQRQGAKNPWALGHDHGYFTG